VWSFALIALGAALLVLGTSAVAHAGAGAVQPPPSHGRFDYQIGGAFEPAVDVAIVDRDRSARPVSGRYGICYINAFQAQPAERRWWVRHHPGLLLRRAGRPVVDRTWNEQLFDTSTRARRAALATIVGKWIDGCAASGFNAVEPDNLDSWTRSQRRLTRTGNLAFAAALIRRAHADGLAIAQKNTGELGPAGRALGFDFAIAEECGAYHECDSYTRAYGDHVIEIEYPDNGGLANFRAACRERGAAISITYRDRDVRPKGAPGFVDRTC
jgi:hypothetical protein